VLAETLAAILALASAGTPHPREAGLSPENTARAHRGLLPRKATVRARPEPRLRHIVLLPPAPTWLGEPGEVAPLVEPAPEARIEPAAAPIEPAGAFEVAVPAAPRWVAVEGAEVEAVVSRRGDPAPLRAAVEEAEVEVFVRRHPRRAGN
jgi:hypothetical protein